MELSEKARKLRNEYQRKWKARNPDKIREYDRRYWEKKAANEQNERPDEQIKKLHRQGLTQRQIAQRLNISVGKVNKIMNRK